MNWMHMFWSNQQLVRRARAIALNEHPGLGML